MEGRGHALSTGQIARGATIATHNARGQQHMLKPCHKTTPDVWDKKKVKPHRTTQGKWPETMRSGWQMAKAEWMADGKGRRQAEGTVQQMATEGTRGQQHM